MKVFHHLIGRTIRKPDILVRNSDAFKICTIWRSTHICHLDKGPVWLVFRYPWFFGQFFCSLFIFVTLSIHFFFIFIFVCWLRRGKHKIMVLNQGIRQVGYFTEKLTQRSRCFQKVDFKTSLVSSVAVLTNIYLCT